MGFLGENKEESVFVTQRGHKFQRIYAQFSQDSGFLCQEWGIVDGKMDYFPGLLYISIVGNDHGTSDVIVWSVYKIIYCTMHTIVACSMSRSTTRLRLFSMFDGIRLLTVL